MNKHYESERVPICIWMSAGVMNYKLCDRDFDCEHCPLDAALRGAPQRSTPLPGAGGNTQRRATMEFPRDRRYSARHTWIQPLEGCSNSFRFGLDGFAASLLTSPRSIRWNANARALRRGDMVCGLEFDGGCLNVGAPMDARMTRRNEGLDDDPDVMRSAPYGKGWIVELEQSDDGEPGEWIPAEEAEELARLDLRRLRRRIALQLLADAGSVGPTLADGGELIADPWRILSGARYLELVRELVH